MTGFVRPLLLPLAAVVPAALAWLAAVRTAHRRVPGLALRPSRTPVGDAAGALALAGVALAWVAAAGPRTAVPGDSTVRGRDVVVLLDVSASMGAAAGRTGAMEGARAAVARLASLRPGDRLALVAFGGKAAVLSPLTLDHATLLALAASLTPATFGAETAIGDALAVALDLLRGTRRGSGAIVLVSDGENNSGAVDPLTAARVAADRGVRVSTVGVGGDPGAGAPAEVDETLLREIAVRTGGEFARAGDLQALASAFERLAKVDPSPVPAPAPWVWSDRTAAPAAAAAALLLAAAVAELASRRIWT